MTQKNKNLSSIITLVIFFMLAIASSPKNMSYSDFDKWVPKDFDPNTCILLIQKHPVNDKQNKRMLEFLEKKYPYRYEVVGAGPIFNPEGKYTNREIYKYAVVWEMKNHQSTSTNTYRTSSSTMTSSTSTRTVYDLYGSFLNLNTREKSKYTKKGMNYGQVGYMPFFNSIVKKFKVKE
jgi:hypothetical protein